MKKLLGIIVLGLLLSGNAYAEIQEWESKVSIGSSKEEMCSATFQIGGDSDYCHKAYQKHYIYLPKYKTEIITDLKPINGEVAYFVFENVNIRRKCKYIYISKKCKHGDGTLKKIAYSEEEAYAYANSDLYDKYIEKAKRAKAEESGDLTFTIKDKKEQCTAIGYAPATEKFADCVLRLVELDVKSQQAAQIALAQSQGNQQLAEQLKKQNNSRSSDAFINLGLKLLSPQSTVSAPTTTNCRVIGSGAYKTVNCW